jgi:hypothetical protein
MDFLMVAPSLLFWYVLYLVPSKYGKLSNIFSNYKNISVTEHSSILPSSENFLQEDISQITQPLISHVDMSYNLINNTGSTLDERSATRRDDMFNFSKELSRDHKESQD